MVDSEFLIVFSGGRLIDYRSFLAPPAGSGFHQNAIVYHDLPRRPDFGYERVHMNSESCFQKRGNLTRSHRLQ